MKYIKKYSLILAVAALAAAACDKTEVPEYEAAPAITSEQVFFPSSVGDEVKIPDGETSFVIPVQRGTANLEALDVEISSSGEGIEYFTIPGTVSFAEKATTASLTITVTDVVALGKNNFYDITLSIADEALTTPYGRSTITISAGIELPWIKFDNGTYFTWWNDAELERTLEYQQISDHMRYCRIQNFWDDEDNPFDMFFYWDTETDYCFVLPTVLEPYDGANNCVMSDMASFYTKYNNWESEIGVIGSDEWFAWAGRWMASRDDVPYYDGNGTFHLADWFYIAGAEDGVPTGRGWQFGGDGDFFKGASFGDYTLEVSYDGMYVSPEGEAVPILGFASTKASAKFYDVVKYAITDQETDADETLKSLAAGELEDVLEIKLVDGAASVQPALEPGLYRLVAVPYVAGDQNDKGEDTSFKTIFAQTIDFYFPGLDVAPKDVEGDIVLLPMAQLYGEDVCNANGYYDYNSIGWVIEGNEIKSGVRGLFKTTVAEANSIETLVANCSALTEAQIASINEKGYYANGFINLDAGTSYTFVVELTNVYGSSKTFTATYSTAEMPYSGELVIGEYVINGSEDTNTITLAPDTEENTFIVTNLGIANEAGWNAVYDPEAYTLTLNGYEHGYEQYGNSFGSIYGYFNSAKTQVYAICVYDSDESEGDDNLVFTVDPTTKTLSKINQDIAVEVYAYEDGNVGDYLGDYAYLEAGSTVSVASKESAPAAAKSFVRKSTPHSGKPAEVKVPFRAIESASDAVKLPAGVYRVSAKAASAAQDRIVSHRVHSNKNHEVISVDAQGVTL